MSTDADLLVDEQGGVLELVLNRPARANSLTASMADEMTSRIAEAATGDTVRVIVIRGEGRSFCSGMDLAQSNAPTRQRPRTGHLLRSMTWGAHRLISTIHQAQLPVVTVVSGYAAGIGLALALSGDYILADETATFWSPFVGRGFSPDSGTTWLLPRLVGAARAKDMILRARKVGAVEAERWGMISELVESDDLERRAREIVEEFASAATVSLGLTKALLNENATATLEQALRNEAIHEELAIRTSDFKMGMQAFVAKEPPAFSGE